MAADPRIGNEFLNPGLGYGGSCFPKDLSSLDYQARQAGYAPWILPATMGVNKQRATLVCEKITKLFGNSLTGKRIAIWGGAFKPNTDDIRESPAFPLIRHLLVRGAEVSLYDPKAMDNLKAVYGRAVAFSTSAESAAYAVNAVVLVTEWDEFTKLDMYAIKEKMYGSLFVDCRNVLSPYVMRDLGFKYICIGNGDSVAKGK